MEIQDLEKRVAAIEQRNRQKEVDKAWETSSTRRICITVLTYGCMVITFYILQNSAPWLSALVPTLGFMLSTLALRSVRKVWSKNTIADCKV